MKKSLIFLLPSLGLMALLGCVGIKNNAIEVRATDNVSSSVPDNSSSSSGSDSYVITKPCQVIIEKTEHGTITTDIQEGEIGEIVTVTAKHDLLYKVESLLVNGAALIEDENTSGKYTFALVEGENKIVAKFVVDKELCGTLSNMISQASNKDWTNLFTVENVIVLIKWVLDGGILIAIIRYFIKDKKLASTVEKKVEEVTSKIVPNATKEAVLENTKTIIEPMFNQAVQDSALTRQLMSIMVKCMVLMQQNTPESKIAILDEFEKLKGVVDVDSIASVKKYIEDTVAAHTQAYNETLARIEKINEQHQNNVEPIEEETPATENSNKDDGTQI